MATFKSLSIVFFTAVLCASGAQQVRGDVEEDAPRVRTTGAGQGFAGNVGRPQDGNGDDGDLALGRPPRLDYALVLTPTTQAENVVTDRDTGLMWVRSLGLLNAADGVGARANVRLERPMSWQAAIQAATDLVYAGHDDWRLPTVNELDTLIDFGRSEPALDPAAFREPYTAFGALPSPYFWSSTTHDAVPFEAFYVNFRDGHRYPWHKAIIFAARPVRTDGPPGSVAVLRTGQQRGYRGNDGEPGDGNGDDGDLRPGEAQAYRVASEGPIRTPEENVAEDRVTGLSWLSDPTLIDGAGGLGGNVALDQPLDWQTALEACAALDYAGFADWRLPNIRELDTLTQPGRPDASQDQAVFAAPPASTDPTQPAAWWSSTTAVFPHPDQRPADGAWYVDAGVPARRHYVSPGTTTPKSRLRHARCVRSAPEPPPPVAYRAAVRSSSDVEALTVATADGGREGKWVLAASDVAAAGLPFVAAFQDASRFPLHLDFLVATFPDHFGGLGPTDYAALAGRRATRRVFAGAMFRWPVADGGAQHGWDVYTEGESERITRSEAVALHLRLSRWHLRRPLAYAPRDPAAMAEALAWNDPRLPVALPASPPALEYEAYVPGIAYGTVRRFTLAELTAAAAGGALGREDIVVVDEAPSDLDQVVAAIVTGAPQGVLSHLSVRAARRGTPDAFVRGAREAFAALDGKLIRLVLSSEGWSAAEASPGEAVAWWAERRPPPVPIPAADTTRADLDDVIAIGALADAVAVFGGKAANLGRLYAFLPAEHQVLGFGIPFAPFAGFMADDARPGGAFAARVAALAADPRMAAGPFRAARLAELREAIRKAPVPDGLVEALAARIDAVFGPGVMVRFRSSSNAEDGLRFNGAGLYDSTSACAADSRDGDSAGPSRCDPNQPEERTIGRALGRVWSSLYTLRAWEERAWYGIDQDAVAMAILVTTAFPDERANGVAFTGDPARPGAGTMLISAQLGDASVVSPEPGLLPERSALLVANGQIVGIRRIQPSTLSPAGQTVLSDGELTRLGTLLLEASARLPIDLDQAPGVRREDVLLDAEFKVRRGDDALLIKQIRPFLAPASDASVTFFAPAPLALCGLWRPIDPIAVEHRERVEVDLAPGELRIPLGAPPPAVLPDLIAAARVGPDRSPATPLGPTTVAALPVAGRPDIARVVLARRFAHPETGLPLRASIALPAAYVDRVTVRALDAAGLTEPRDVVAAFGPDAGGDERLLGPCGLQRLPREALRLRFADGWLDLDLRKADAPLAPYQWAALVGARLHVAGSTRTVTDLAHLTYDAERHNWNERFLVMLDPPLAGTGSGPAHALEIAWQTGAALPTVRRLDAHLEPIGDLVIRYALRQRAVDGAATLWMPRAFGD